MQVIRQQKDQKHFYWGNNGDYWPFEMMGGGYILSMDLVSWIATSNIPPNNTLGPEDEKVSEWLAAGHLDDNKIVNRTAFIGYPWPELGDHEYHSENAIRPFERWTLVIHPLKEDFMWVETAEYYLGLEW